MSIALSTALARGAHVGAEILIVASVALVALGCSKRNANDVPIIADLPDFSLVDQDEQVFNRGSLEGNLWVSAFVFTHCRATCPRLTAQMKRLQARASDVLSARFLSVSVDPRNDTPEVIKAYMTGNGLDESNWRFVTGSEAEIANLVIGGFQVGFGRTRWASELTHSNSFALVDGHARIRGYYASDDEGITDLERDLRALATEVPENR